jgi:diguanylate cyclase (GGDEF)-like protein
MSESQPTSSASEPVISARLHAIQRLTDAVRSVHRPATGAAFLDLLAAVAEAVVDNADGGERCVIWLISHDGTRMRQVTPARIEREWTPATGPVAQVLGPRRAIEMGLAEGESIGLVTRATARSTTDEDRRPNRPFGRFIPIRHGNRIGAVLGVVRAPGRPLFELEDRIVLDAAVERLENAFATQSLADELTSERTRGISQTNGILMSGSLLARLGQISGDTVFRYLFNGIGTNYISDGVLTAIGYTTAEVSSDPALFDRVIHPDDRHLITDLASDPTLADVPLLVRFLRRNGQISWQLLRVVALCDETGRVIGVEGFSTDVTTMKLAEAEFAHQARSDALTGLSNRLNFREATSRALARIARHPGTLAVLFLDLDGFKRVNDTLGHAAGDDVLRQVADRLRRVIRREDLVARLGGDEFAVLLAEIRDPGEASATARRILASLEQPILANGQTASISTGVGIAIAANADTDPDELINRADIALYQAKRVGRGRWQVFEGPSGTLASTTTPTEGGGPLHPSVDDQRSVAIVSEGALRASLAGAEFRVYYLPQFGVTNGLIQGVEALVRWQHPEFGLLPAEAFIDQANATEVIHPLGDWVLREACQNFALWQRTRATDLQLWINVSAEQLSRSGFVESFLATLQSTGVGPETVGVDVPESAFAQLDTVREHALATLVRAGVKLAVDEFGLGGSSLRTLRKLPLTQIKLDRRIVDGIMEPEGEGAELVPLAVKLAASLGSRVVAVGVERREQLDRLNALHVDSYQGALSGSPLTADEIEHLLVGGVVPAATLPTMPEADNV